MHRWIRETLVEADKREEAILLAGDLNPAVSNPTPTELAMRRRLENPLAFREAWWHSNGRANDDTHTRNTSAGISRRKLDFIFLSGWLDKVIQCSKSTVPTLLGEDHNHLWAETTGYVQPAGVPQPLAPSRPRLAFHQAARKDVEAFQREMEGIILGDIADTQDPGPTREGGQPVFRMERDGDLEEVIYQ
ncbi:hypothetical protein IWW37_006170, partial [Coemansia sp. RSA 2050]